MSVRFWLLSAVWVAGFLGLYVYVAHAHKPLYCPCFAISDECWKY